MGRDGKSFLHGPRGRHPARPGRSTTCKQVFTPKRRLRAPVPNAAACPAPKRFCDGRTSGSPSSAATTNGSSVSTPLTNGSLVRFVELEAQQRAPPAVVDQGRRRTACRRWLHACVVTLRQRHEPLSTPSSHHGIPCAGDDEPYHGGEPGHCMWFHREVHAASGSSTTIRLAHRPAAGRGSRGAFIYNRLGELCVSMVQEGLTPHHQTRAHHTSSGVSDATYES